MRPADGLYPVHAGPRRFSAAHASPARSAPCAAASSALRSGLYIVRHGAARGAPMAPMLSIARPPVVRRRAKARPARLHLGRPPATSGIGYVASAAGNATGSGPGSHCPRVYEPERHERQGPWAQPQISEAHRRGVTNRSALQRAQPESFGGARHSWHPASAGSTWGA